jgi:hypothetical protein
MAASKSYRPGLYPQIDADLSTYLTAEFASIQRAIESLRVVVASSPLVDAVDDAAAEAAGVPINGLYHNAGAVMVRLV